MKLSIITPCKTKDIEKIKQLATNLNRQDNKEIEWIVACNSSELDLSGLNFPVDIIKFDGDNVAQARNAAIREAHGEYLMFVDADDFLLPGTINNVIDKLKPGCLVDLKVYPTYEPVNSYFNEINQKQEFRMPNWAFRRKPEPEAEETLLNDKFHKVDKKSVFEEISHYLKISGKIIPKGVIWDNDILFDEENPLYDDFYFMGKVLNIINSFIEFDTFKYVKVKHNDPINDPSLSQIECDDRWNQMLNSFIKTADLINANNLKDCIIIHSIKKINKYFYNAVVNNHFSSSKQSEIMDIMSGYFASIDHRLFKNVNIISRHILFNIRKHNYAKAIRQMKLIIALRYTHKILRNKGRGITRAYYEVICKKLKVNEKVIVYESFLGRNYSDSPKYIYQYSQKHYPGQFKHVWIAAKGSNVKKDLANEPNTKVVKRFGFRYMYYLGISKYQVINMRQPRWFNKKPGTVFMSTWHGTPLKHLVFDMENVASATRLYKKIFYEQSRQWDYLVTANQFSVDVFKHAFMYPEQKMIKSGYPRNDILSAPNREELSRNIKEKLGIPLNKKVILYAPTWRDDEYVDVGQYKFQLKLNIAKLREQLGDDYVMVLRTHYFITNNLDTSGFGNFVYNESSYDDISELYLISDILITDYSSVFFDYSILRRPILYYVYDYDKYASVLRGFYLDMNKDLPGPLLKTSDEVIDSIKNIDQVSTEYADKYAKFNERFSKWEDGHASERVVNMLLKNDARVKKID
ncbi:glycosyl glycerophosphate transferase [Apilactobacillus ozensis DSM 23829 = JCM 17196]|uniref:Glycosyl glycerophosphate transferase n=1 Tax=Apilactobacillus ozensis DSM 23829 = JCM 17196 TaxID=1423781 RepID=A0A0R2AX60_9LACO|nr:bifunctional glycosyltransferase family 2 protein/CDP-glycerol:glycerophosphate glycerophosphotransferase [Apilactobacillus ozensis]KRM67827.1 glycosyl glycerophosphate transferase [Apilactobacillus ozensis DSM 23829 = JCM 17196]